MIVLGAGVLFLLFASLFVFRSGRKLEEVEADAEATVEDYEIAAEAMSDWGAGATLTLCGIGLIVVSLVLAA